jgi:hypothetical protein
MTIEFAPHPALPKGGRIGNTSSRLCRFPIPFCYRARAARDVQISRPIDLVAIFAHL